MDEIISASQKRTLVVVNYMTPTDYPLLQSFVQKQKNLIEFHLVYIIPVIPAAYFQVPTMANAERALIDSAKVELLELGSRLGIPAMNQWVRQGQCNRQVEELKNQIDANDIIWRTSCFYHEKPAFSTLSESILSSLVRRVNQLFTKDAEGYRRTA
jgi:hypothetical protein